MADRYIQLYFDAIEMRAMLQLECAYALQFVDLLDNHFNMLGTQVVDALCRTGIVAANGHSLYQPQELTLALIRDPRFHHLGAQPYAEGLLAIKVQPRSLQRGLVSQPG